MKKLIRLKWLLAGFTCILYFQDAQAQEGYEKTITTNACLQDVLNVCAGVAQLQQFNLNVQQVKQGKLELWKYCQGFGQGQLNVRIKVIKENGRTTVRVCLLYEKNQGLLLSEGFFEFVREVERRLTHETTFIQHYGLFGYKKNEFAYNFR